jgi:hypothetical protein
VDVDSEGNGWVSDTNNEIFHHTDGKWELIEGNSAIDVGVGA